MVYLGISKAKKLLHFKAESILKIHFLKQSGSKKKERERTAKGFKV